ncbi:hypothetical protein [Rhizobium esperanzae]|uniref:20S proteasome subunit A/B n=1 Tax=Rhizobium esperanzae TaxID=1967781 RepID=A0A7W6R5P4_9HYPH|nr:hypothetical protein [Rhizobium esperanzae]MBB4236662.1 hypothetical protein [Rhizobium esperanzae]
MSAIFSFAYPDCIQVLTDGAWVSETGELMRVKTKSFASSRHPIAFTGRGTSSVQVMNIIDELLAFAESEKCAGVDAALGFAEAYFERMAKGGPFNGEIVIAAYSETKGTVHFVVACHDHYGLAAPFRLENPAAQILLGPTISLDDFPPGAFSPEDVASSNFPARHGAMIMEALRRKPARIIGWEREFFAVGGLCDLTTVNAAGADVRPLCGWADEVGKTIDPNAPRIYEGFTYAK